MRKIVFLLSAVLFLSGCATYRFQHGEKPYDKGYVVARDDFIMSEYTIGKDNTVPAIKLAKERFNRRRYIVEDYYKRMGRIDNHLKMVAWDSAISFLKIVTGVFRLPFIAISDYRCRHDPAYKERVRRLEEEQDAFEEARIAQLKSDLSEYISRDLAWEGSGAKTKPPKPAVRPIQKKPKVKKEKISPKEKPAREKSLKIKPQAKEVRSKESVGEPVAVIVAKPIRGVSPLRVQFYGNKSYSNRSRIVSYQWDFGDGDTSAKPNPVNIYYSGSFDVKDFTVTLAVQDDKGRTAEASTTIEVANR